MINFSDFFQTLPDMAFIFDEKGAVIEVNEVALSRLGFDESTLKSQGISALLPPASLDTHALYLKPKKRNRKDRTMMDRSNLAVMNSQGEQIPALISITPIERMSGSHYLVFARDLTGVKRDEETRRLHTEIEGLRSRYRSLETLVTNLIDDINNSLMVLLGHSKVVRRMVPNHEKVTAQMAGIMLAVDQIHSSMDGLQSLLGVTKTERELLDPLEIVSEIVDRFNDSYATCIDFSNEFEHRVKIFVGRKDMVTAITNILTNAYEAAPDRKDLISLSLDVVRSDEKYFESVHCMTPLATDRNYLEVSVSDRGPGLSTKRLTALFEPSVPGDTVEALNGLGIPASLTSIRALGGTVAIDRSKVNGAKVSLLIPVLGLSRNSTD